MVNKRIYRGHIPCVRFLVSFIAGLAVAYFIEPTEILYGIVAGFTFFSLTAFVLLSLIGQYGKNHSIAGLGIFLFSGLFFGAWTLLWKTNPTIQRGHFSKHRAEVLIGVIQEEPERVNGFIRFILEVEKSIHEGKKRDTDGLLLVYIRTDSTHQYLNYGDEIMLPASYQEVSPPYNPHEFDYRAYLANKDIWHAIFIEPAQYKKVGKGNGNPLIQLAFSLRRKMLHKFEKYVPDKDALSIVSALVLGYRNEMKKEIVNAFSVTGTIHVLSVSGLHVGIVFLVFSAALYWMKIHPGLNMVKGMLIIVLIWVYALITGFSPSILRAAIMISFTLLSFQFMHNGNVYNTLAASALFLLIYHPKYIRDVGFQLSYLAVIAIVFLYPKVKLVLPVKNKILAIIWDYIALSIAAQVATFPLVIYYFHNFPTYFLPANLFVIIPATLIVYLGFALLFIPSGIVTVFIGNVLQTLIRFMKEVLMGFEHLPYASFGRLWLNGWQMLLVYGFLSAFIFSFTLRKKLLLYWSCVCIILLLCIQLKAFIYQYEIQEIRFYNVYQNMAIVIFNHDKTILYTDSLTRGNKRFQYAVEADLSAMKRGENTVFLELPAWYRSPDLVIENNLIQFGDKRILIYNTMFKSKNPLNVDILYIRKNPRETLGPILQKIKCKLLLIDGSNSTQRIREYVREAASLSIPTYVLKNNFAYVW